MKKLNGHLGVAVFLIPLSPISGFSEQNHVVPMDQFRAVDVAQQALDFLGAMPGDAGNDLGSSAGTRSMTVSRVSTEVPWRA